MASCFVRKTGIVCVRCFRRARVLGIVNALAAWMFHIPSRIALLGWPRGFIVDYGGHFRVDDGPAVHKVRGEFDFRSWHDRVGLHVMLNI